MKVIKQETLSKIAEAKQVFEETKWVIEKLAERSLLGEDVSGLIKKYSKELEAREKARAKINELESLLK